MENEFKYSSIYFVGAGGIGMAALERYFLAKGCRVAGYDRTRTALTDALASEGVEIFYEEDATLIPDYCRDPQSTLVVYTPAIPDDHAGLQYFRQGGFKVVKRAELLGIVTQGSRGLCFSGTHGKTTTSSMAAHILHCSPIGCNAFLGGILRNYDSNFLLDNNSQYTVVEADEYDRSFHHLRPYIAVVTATDPDHLDIYGTEEAYLESFAHFTELVVPGGVLIVKEGIKLKPRPVDGVRVYSYSRDSGDFHAANVRKGNGEIHFDFVAPGGVEIKDINLGVPVDVNIENAVAAMAVCYLVGVEADVMRDAISSFLGAKRRFEFWLKGDDKYGHVLIDDYAHHPEEIRASILSVRDLYPGRKLTVIFQPHLYSRTRDFASQFADALSLADEVMILDIYPAREEPIPGVTSEIISDAFKCRKARILCDKRDMVDVMRSREYEHEVDVVLTVGAGDISNYLPRLCKVLTHQEAW